MIDDLTQARETVDAWLDDALAASGAQPIAEPQPSKRAEVRYPWSVPMELMDGVRTHYIQCRDISRSGVGTLCRTLFEVDGRVYLRRDEHETWVPCRVAHCTATVGNFRVGVELRFDF
jgi:hypothetical protein